MAEAYPDLHAGQRCSPASSARARRRCCAACCADPALRRHRGAHQRVRRGRARPSSVERLDDNMVLLQSGCLCCTDPRRSRGARCAICSRRASAGSCRPFDRLVIESTGLADPFPILSTIRPIRFCATISACGNVIVTVDAVNGLEPARASCRIGAASGDRRPPGRHQDRYRRGGRRRALVDAASGAQSHARRCCAPPKGRSTADGLCWQDRQRRMVQGAPPEPHDRRPRRITSGCAQPSSSTVDEPLDWTAFGVWLTMLLNRHGAEMLRVKGHPERCAARIGRSRCMACSTSCIRRCIWSAGPMPIAGPASSSSSMVSIPP